MTRTMLALGSILALAGCGGGGLEVSGHVDVTTAGATTTGFNFPQPVRLDGGAGLITGSCVMTRGETGYGIVVDLFSSDANPEGRAIRSMTLMLRSDGTSSSIDAQLGQDDFESDACQMRVIGLDGASGQVAFQTTSDCTITGPAGETATVAVDLGLTRCGVQ